MKIQVNTDKHIEGGQRLENFLNEKLHAALDRFSDKLTRIEVHLSDQNGAKGGADDLQCILEARLEGMQPITVTNRAGEMDATIHGAIDKMKSALDTTLGKLRAH